MPEVVVIGAGMSGLSAAVTLSDSSSDFVVLEKNDTVGGLVTTTSFENFRFDHGPHVIVAIPDELKETFSRMGVQLIWKSCNSSIYLSDFGIHAAAPIQRNLSRLPLTKRVECLVAALSARIGTFKHARTYRETAVQRLGSCIVDLFVAPYDAKRLRHRLTELHPSYAERLTPVSLVSVLCSVLGLPDDHPGLDSTFLYPAIGGIAELPEALDQLIPAGTISLNTQVTEIDIRARRMSTQTGKQLEFRSIISTIPLPELISLIRDVPNDVSDAAKSLTSVGTLICNLVFASRLNGPSGIIRVPDPEFVFYRISFPKSYAGDLVSENFDVVVAEISYSTAIPIDVKALPSIVLGDLRKMGVVGSTQNPCCEYVMDVPRNHLISKPDTPAAVDKVRQWLWANGIMSCGKYGMWQEMLMTQAMLSGRAAAFDVTKRVSGTS